MNDESGRPPAHLDFLIAFCFDLRARRRQQDGRAHQADNALNPYLRTELEVKPGTLHLGLAAHMRWPEKREGGVAADELPSQWRSAMKRLSQLRHCGPLFLLNKLLSGRFPPVPSSPPKSLPLQHYPGRRKQLFLKFLGPKNWNAGTFAKAAPL